MNFEGILGRQTFAGNDLIRGGTPPQIMPFNTMQKEVIPCFALVSERQIDVEEQGESYTIAWHSPSDMIDMGFDVATCDIPDHEFIKFYPDPYDQNQDSTIDVPYYYLGSREELSSNQIYSYYACDVSGVCKYLEDEIFIDLRKLLPLLSYEDLAYAGHAVALAQWHQNHQFCSKCGSPTVAISSGAKRQCQRNPLHKHYPRTDPVIITLVLLDTDAKHTGMKEKALLGRSKNLPAGTLTCLSGFIDQGESIEEAVAREVKEESGVIVHSVEILGSQPWPIGRGGSCELMIGCVARTSSRKLNIDFTEMAECRWVDKEEILAALQNSLNPNSPFISRVSNRNERASDEPGGEIAGQTQSILQQQESRDTVAPVFFVPPPYAIAHHLLKYWAEGKLDSSKHSNPHSNM